MNRQMILLAHEARLQQLQLMQADAKLEAKLAEARGEDPLAFEAIADTVDVLMKAERARSRRLLKLWEV